MHQPYRTETNNAPLSPFKLGVMAADGTIHQISPPPCARRQACKRRGSDAAGCSRGPAGHTACTRVAVSSAAADMKAVAGDGGEGGGGGAFIAGKLFTDTRNPKD